MIGLTENSETKEMTVQKDESTAIKYKVTEEVINLAKLRAEKTALVNEINKSEPSDEELIELGKSIHEYYTRDISYLQTRIDEINLILGEE